MYNDGHTNTDTLTMLQENYKQYMFRNLAGDVWRPLDSINIKFFDKDVRKVTFVNNGMVVSFDDGSYTYPVHTQSHFVFWKMELIDTDENYTDAG